MAATRCGSSPKSPIRATAPALSRATLPAGTPPKTIANRKPSMSASASEQSVENTGVAPPASGIGHVLGIPVTVDVVLGATTMLVADLMNLSRGATIPLDGKIVDQVTIAVNGRTVARGEILVLE